MISNRTWNLWAHRYEGDVFLNVGPKPYVKLHGLSHPIVPVLVTEVPEDAPDGTHWGWLWTDGHQNWCDGAPSMMWPHRGQFDMCFTYGAKAEEEAGKGRVVRLRITQEKKEAE